MKDELFTGRDQVWEKKGRETVEKGCLSRKRSASLFLPPSSLSAAFFASNLSFLCRTSSYWHPLLSSPVTSFIPLLKFKECSAQKPRDVSVTPKTRDFSCVRGDSEVSLSFTDDYYVETCNRQTCIQLYYYYVCIAILSWSCFVFAQCKMSWWQFQLRVKVCLGLSTQTRKTFPSLFDPQ